MRLIFLETHLELPDIVKRNWNNKYVSSWHTFLCTSQRFITIYFIVTVHDGYCAKYL